MGLASFHASLALAAVVCLRNDGEKWQVKSIWTKRNIEELMKYSCGKPIYHSNLEKQIKRRREAWSVKGRNSGVKERGKKHTMKEKRQDGRKKE